MAQDDIQGQVVDAQGNPVEGAIVEVTPARRDDSELEENVVRVSTNSNGEYRVWYHPQGDGTTQEWHVSCYNYDGTAYVNSFNNPGVTADLRSNAIADSEDLYAHYDFSQEDGTLPVTDLSDSGNDLDTGGYSGVGVTINGVQAGDFDGVNDGIKTTFTSVSQPISVFIVYEPRSIVYQTGAARILDGESNATFVYQTSDADTLMSAGTDLSGSPVDTSPHLFGGIYNTSSSIMRQDGSQDVTGAVGSNDQNGITIGKNGSLSDNFYDGKIGELLFYNGDKSSIASDIENYLNDKWGVF